MLLKLFPNPNVFLCVVKAVMLCMNSVPNIILLIEMYILFIMIFYSLGPLRIVIFLIGDQLRRSGKGKGKGST